MTGTTAQTKPSRTRLPRRKRVWVVLALGAILAWLAIVLLQPLE